MITDMSVPNLLGLALRPRELEMRCDITAQLVFHKQVLPPVVLTRVTFGNYRQDSYVTRIVLNLLKAVEHSDLLILYFYLFISLYKPSQTFVD